MADKPLQVDELGGRGIGVELRAVCVELDGVRVLRRISLELASGSHTLLIGPNGAGKSQLLKVLSGERWPTPTKGCSRTYRGYAGAPLELRDLLPRLQLVSAEQQDRYERYDWNFAVTTVVGTGCRGLNAPLGPLTRKERIHAHVCLRAMGLWTLRRRRFLTLSYGQRRLVLIARALAARPALLLLDEIYNGLDAAHRRRLDRVLDRLCLTPLTLVVTAHRAEDAPAGLDAVVAIQRGRLRYAGPRRLLPAAYAGYVSGRSAGGPAVRARKESPPAAPVTPLVVLERASVFRDYRPVLRGIDWTVGAGENWVILGPNGSGKTTLLSLLHGTLWAADGGRVLRRGHEPGQRVEDWQARVRYLSPDSHVGCLDSATLTNVVLTGIPHLRRLDARPTGEQLAAADAALRLVGLVSLASRSPRAVSYGQLRLTLLARALIGRPEALLLDEPLTGLDSKTRNRMRAVLTRLAANGTQLIAAVHHADDLIPAFSRALVLPSGRQRRL